MNNLIICPVGSPLTFDDRFDKENHWRYTKENRLYETLIFQYSDFKPENNTYDQIIVEKGFKWSFAKKYLKYMNYEKYDYIGFLDDDLITDIQNINRALTTAKERDLKIFQLSVTKDSDMFWDILINKPGVKYTKTNYVEIMGPFIHTSLIPICIELWDSYDIFSGWGFDKVLCNLTETDAAVIHESQMYHPKRNSDYDKTKAFAEMDKLMYEVFPNFMKRKNKHDWEYRDIHKELEVILES